MRAEKGLVYIDENEELYKMAKSLDDEDYLKRTKAIRYQTREFAISLLQSIEYQITQVLKSKNAYNTSDLATIILNTFIANKEGMNVA